MIITGAILLALGIGSTIYGFHLNNSVEAQLNSLFGSGNVDPGTGWIVAGIIALVIGIIFLIVGIARRSGVALKMNTSHIVSAKSTSLCPNCGKTLDGSPAFCPFCGKNTKTANPKKENVCPYCESILPEGVAFCPACGKQVALEHSAKKSGPTTSKSTDFSTSGGWSLPTDSDL